ncbi:MAG: ATP-binding protein [Chloroflexi bacterium]|nr:ATP-binding protein [Chloroflexota bacterium]
MLDATLSADVDRIERALTHSPAIARPFLLMLSGLPGTGKSTQAKKLAERLSATIIESDDIRRKLFAAPAFTDVESSYVFQVCYLVMERLLKKGVPIVFDATNRLERHRQQVYDIAEACKADLHIVHVDAPQAIVRERLERRLKKPGIKSQAVADWKVYVRMRRDVERIGRPHMSINTAKETDAAIEKVVAAVKQKMSAEERK